MTSCDHAGHDQIDRNCPEYAGLARFEQDTTIDGPVPRFATSDPQAAGSRGLPIRPSRLAPRPTHSLGFVLFTAARFGDAEVFNVDSPGIPVCGFGERWVDRPWRELLLAAARLVESEPEMIVAASHRLAVARKPARTSR